MMQYSVFEGRMTRKRVDAVAPRNAAPLGLGASLRVDAFNADGLSRGRVYGEGVPFEADTECWYF